VCGVVALLTVPTVAAEAPRPDVQAARKYLHDALQDERRVPLALVMLQATEDRDLVPLLAAFLRSAEERVRMLAVAALGRLKGDEAVAALDGCVRKDPSMTVRAHALGQLLERGAAKPALLTEALKLPAENVQLVAARGLVLRKRGDQAAPVLRKISESKDVLTASMARMSLLGLGDRQQREPLAKVLRDPKSSPQMVELLLGQVAEEKIAAALPLADLIATSPDRPMRSRVIAYRAMASATPRGAQRVLEAIRKSDRMIFRVYLFRILALQPDARGPFQTLASETDVIGSLARFELVRPAGGPPAAKAAADALACRHPVVVTHVLKRIKEDIDLARRSSTSPADPPSVPGPRKADCYAPVLLDLVRSVPPPGPRLGAKDTFAAQAAGLLGDLGTPAAMTALRGLLSGDQRGPKRAAVAGLVRTTNRSAALLARPLLDSPYRELSTTAALALGRFAEPAAAGALADVVQHSHRYPPQVAIMAAWYLLKIHHQARQAAETLAETIK